MHRITGCTLSGMFYVFGAAYLVAPYMGWHLETAVMAASIAKWPAVIKIFSKFSIGWIFTYKSFNGVRHLMWDTASMISNKQVNQSGWFVVGASALAALALAFV